MFTAASVDRMLQCPPGLPMMMDNNRTWKPHIELAPNCPRCASSNTKFCYYNNYSLSQPRYFCKGCRRYWTKGGSLRNVPVGGGCRKNRRGKSVRLSQAERASLTDFHQNSSSTDDSSEHSNVQQGGTNGSDIDLAVVFANFLNHNNSSHDDHDHDHHPNLLVSSELMHDEEGNALSDQSQISSKAADSDQCQLMKPAHDDDLVEVAVAQLLEGVLAPNHHDHDHQQLQVEENIIQNFMGNHHHDHHDHMNHEFGLQGLLGDEDDQVVEDVFWSDAAAAATLTSSSSTSFTWQELDSFPSHVDDHIKISTKNVCNNWSSFDFSGFEVFSRS